LHVTSVYARYFEYFFSDGEEGVRDLKIIDAICLAVKEGKKLKA
jgi:hypothetical protein